MMKYNVNVVYPDAALTCKTDDPQTMMTFVAEHVEHDATVSVVDGYTGEVLAYFNTTEEDYMTSEFAALGMGLLLASAFLSALKGDDEEEEDSIFPPDMFDLNP